MLKFGAQCPGDCYTRVVDFGVQDIHCLGGRNVLLNLAIGEYPPHQYTTTALFLVLEHLLNTWRDDHTGHTRTPNVWIAAAVHFPTRLASTLGLGTVDCGGIDPCSNCNNPRTSKAPCYFRHLYECFAVRTRYPCNRTLVWYNPFTGAIAIDVTILAPFEDDGTGKGKGKVKKEEDVKEEPSNTKEEAGPSSGAGRPKGNTVAR